MGIFERIRTASPYLLTAFAVIFILFMVLSDLDFQTLLGQGNDPSQRFVAEIGEQKVSYLEYEDYVRNEVEYKKRELKQQGLPEEIDENFLRTTAYNSIVEMKILEGINNGLGMEMTDAIIADQLLVNPPQQLKQQFSDSTGTFDQASYIQAVTNPESFVARLSSQIPAEQKTKIVQSIRESMIAFGKNKQAQLIEYNSQTLLNSIASNVSSKFMKDKFIRENSTANFEYIYIDANMIDDSKINVTDEAIKEFYEMHKEAYKRDEQRKIKYVTIKLAPSKYDSLKAEKRVADIANSLSTSVTSEDSTKTFDKFAAKFGFNSDGFQLLSKLDPTLTYQLSNPVKGKVYGPIRTYQSTNFYKIDDIREGTEGEVKASHILITFGDNKDSALKLTNEIISKAKSGTPFGELAAEYSMDKSNASNGGDLGWFGKGKMVTEFEDAAFGANVGDLVGPVETQYGYHIINLLGKESKEIAISKIEIKPVMTSQTRKMIYQNAINFAEQSKSGFEAAAEKLGLEVGESAPFIQRQSILGSGFLTSFVFKNEVGAVTEPIEIKNYGIVIAKVTEVLKSGIPTMEELKNELNPLVKEKLKVDYAMKVANDLYPNVKSGNFAQASTQNFIKVSAASDIRNDGALSGINAREYSVTNEAFKLNPGQVSKPIKGTTGAFIVKLTYKSIAPESDLATKYEEFKNQQMQAAKGNTFFQWFNNIKDNTQIIDKRADFYSNY